MLSRLLPFLYEFYRRASDLRQEDLVKQNLARVAGAPLAVPACK
ncbi:MAG TPA: hypothetical protein VMH28_15015 [Candidatus Acidoferrales bacterium]|nr:hypothetical protein [Candidatus Acidoferrales bacterium]